MDEMDPRLVEISGRLFALELAIVAVAIDAGPKAREALLRVRAGLERMARDNPAGVMLLLRSRDQIDALLEVIDNGPSEAAPAQ